MGLVGDVKLPKPALLLSLDVWHNPSNFNLIVGLKPQRLISLNTIKLRHITVGTLLQAGARMAPRMANGEVCQPRVPAANTRARARLMGARARVSAGECTHYDYEYVY